MPDSETKGSLFIPEYGNIRDPNVRAKYGYLEAAVSIVGNILLFVLKFFLGIFINSIALIADAFHTLSDVGTSGVVIFGFRLSKKPADKEHPFGHGRAEYIATIIIAVLLVIVGFEFIRESYERIIAMESLSNEEFALIIGIVICISAVVKELMAQFGIVIGKKIKSDVLIADAWHHRSDAIASVAVGVSIIGSAYGYKMLDPVFGIIVSLIIIWVGIDLLRKSGNTLMGAAPDAEIINEIKKIVGPMKETKGIDEVYLHDYGTEKIVSLHVNVSNELTLNEAHEIADRIEFKVKKGLGYNTIIHLEPAEVKSDDGISKLIIQNILDEEKDIVSFHKIQIFKRGKMRDIKMHILVDGNMSIKKSHKLHHKLEEVIKEKYGPSKVNIHIEPCNGVCEACHETCEKKN